jgi:hypothetical protein
VPYGNGSAGVRTGCSQLEMPGRSDRWATRGRKVRRGLFAPSRLVTVSRQVLRGISWSTLVVHPIAREVGSSESCKPLSLSKDDLDTKTELQIVVTTL